MNTNSKYQIKIVINVGPDLIIVYNIRNYIYIVKYINYIFDICNK